MAATKTAENCRSAAMIKTLDVLHPVFNGSWKRNAGKMSLTAIKDVRIDLYGYCCLFGQPLEVEEGACSSSKGAQPTRTQALNGGPNKMEILMSRGPKSLTHDTNLAGH